MWLGPNYENNENNDNNESLQAISNNELVTKHLTAVGVLFLVSPMFATAEGTATSMIVPLTALGVLFSSPMFVTAEGRAATSIVLLTTAVGVLFVPPLTAPSLASSPLPAVVASPVIMLTPSCVPCPIIGAMSSWFGSTNNLLTTIVD